jgi:hypothetical protein
VNWPLIGLISGMAMSGILGCWLFSKWLSRNDRKWIDDPGTG